MMPSPPREGYVGSVVVEEAPDVLRTDVLRSKLNTEGCGAVVSFVGLTREHGRPGRRVES